MFTRHTLREENFWRLLPASFPVSIAVMLASTGLLGRMSGQWVWGFFLGASLSLAAALGIIFLVRRPNRIQFHINFQKRDWPLVLVILTGTFLVTAVLFRFSIFDETGIQGHIAVTESILRGVYPPKYLSFPEIHHKYHFGFNLFSAIVGQTFHLPAYQSVDVASLIAWIALLGALLVLVEALAIPRVLWGTAVLFVLFSGGFFWPGLSGEGTPLWQMGKVYGRQLAPHVVAYFFQHPVGFGTSLLLGAVYFFGEWFRNPRISALLVASLILGALSLVQAVLFATIMAALGLVFLFRLFQKITPKKTYWLHGGLALLLTGGLAVGLGGLFQISAGNEGGLLSISWPPGYLRHEYWGGRIPLTPSQAFLWYLRCFGIALFLAPPALLAAFRRTDPVYWVLAVFCVLGFMIPQIFHYRFSWDIVKWFYIFDLFVRILILCAFGAWIARKSWRLGLAWIVVLYGSLIPFFFLKNLALDDPLKFTGAGRRYNSVRQVQIPPGFQPLVDFMKDCEACRGTVWSSPGTSELLAPFTGFPMLQLDYKITSMPIRRAELEKRRALIQNLESNPSRDMLSILRIRWIVFQCQELPSLSEPVRNFLAQLKTLPGIEDHSLREDAKNCVEAYFIKPEN